jgi:hypothetical protein
VRGGGGQNGVFWPVFGIFISKLVTS